MLTLPISLLWLWLLCAVCGCEREPSPDLSTSATRPAMPVVAQRIVSLAPSVTEELFLLKADDRLIADTDFCDRPESAKQKRKVGSLKDFDLETVIGLQPDLVLSTNLADSKKIAKLKQLGIAVIALPPPKNFEQICENFLALGRAVGRASLAESIISEVNVRVQRIRKLTQALPQKRVFMQIGARPLVTVSHEYFINDYIRYAGGDNISGQALSNLYNRESVLINNPEVILITDMGLASEAEKRAWEKYPSLIAAKNKDVHIVDSKLFCNPTINAFLESLQITASILHPEIRSALLPRDH
jgi:iron complex transport system substrate-binding protein